MNVLQNFDLNLLTAIAAIGALLICAYIAVRISGWTARDRLGGAWEQQRPPALSLHEMELDVRIGQLESDYRKLQSQQWQIHREFDALKNKKQDPAP